MNCDKLYYDGQCPLCSEEMEKLQHLAEGKLQLVNIHDLKNQTDLPDKKSLLTLLHLQQTDGNFLTGLDANVAAWQHTRLGVYVRWLRWPLIKPLADLIYKLWAQRRYQQLYNRKKQ